MKQKLIEAFKPFIKTNFNKDYEKILKYTYIRYIELCNENQDSTKELKKHTFTKIFPCIAIYESLLEANVEYHEAADFIDKTYMKLSEKEAKQLRLLNKIPFFYHLMPKMFTKTLKSSFNEKAGFKYKIYDTPKSESRFDMLECPYMATCKKYNAEIICKAFCHSDDVKDANMHPKLIWERHSTLGEGGELCDFRFYEKKDK